MTARASQSCPNGHAFEPGFRFCPECGRPAMAVCGKGHGMAPDHKFCPQCGAPAVGHGEAELELPDARPGHGGNPDDATNPASSTMLRITRAWGYMDGGGKYRVFLDGREIGRVGNGKTEEFAIQSGRHTL